MRQIETRMHALAKTGILVFLTVTLPAEEQAPGFKVPLYMTVGIQSGYDTNALRFSRIEKQEAGLDGRLLGSGRAFDSVTNRFTVSIRYNPEFVRNRPTALSGTVRFTRYHHVPDKQYSSGNLTLSQRLGPYRHLRFSTRWLRDYYLRDYQDRDQPGNPRKPTRFTQITYLLTAVHPVPVIPVKRTWITGSVRYDTQYYNPPFIEFDTILHGLELSLTTQALSRWELSIEGAWSQADNSSYNTGYISTYLDRSYHNRRLALPIRYKPRWSALEEIGLRMDLDRRDYLTESFDDPLHSGRSHTQIQLRVWSRIVPAYRTSLEPVIYYRYRRTDSAYARVVDLKTYHQWQFWLNLSWELYFDPFF